MTTILQVPAPELAGLGTRLAGHADDIDAVLDELDVEVAALLGRWSGDARDAFEQAYATWRAEAGLLRASLTAAARAVEASADAFEVAESDNVGLWPL